MCIRAQPYTPVWEFSIEWGPLGSLRIQPSLSDKPLATLVAVMREDSLNSRDYNIELTLCDRLTSPPNSRPRRGRACICLRFRLFSCLSSCVLALFAPQGRR